MLQRAMEEHNAALCPEDWGCKEYIGWLRKALAEKDAQIAALQEDLEAEELAALEADATHEQGEK
jgi:hypothetical protein